MTDAPEIAEIRRLLDVVLARHNDARGEGPHAYYLSTTLHEILYAAERLAGERDALRGYAQKMEAWVIRDTARLGGDTEGMANELRRAAGVTSLLSHDDGEENDVALTDRAE